MRGVTPTALDVEGRARRELLRRFALTGAAALVVPGAWAAGRDAMARRIVCVGGALTEIAYALGGGGDLVGVDTTSLYPEAATRLPSVGYARTLSAEGVLALAPGRLIVSEDAGPPAVLRQIAAAGVPISVLAANNHVEGVLERITHMGELLGRVPQASKLVASVRTDWQRVRQVVAARKARPPRVLFVLSHSPSQVMVAGAGSSAQAMIEYAGGVNAITGIDGYKPLTPEAVIAAQPDVVLFTDQGLKAIGGVAAALRLPGLASTPAGRQQRIIAQEAVFLLGFGPRIASAVAALDEALVKAMAS